MQVQYHPVCNRRLRMAPLLSVLMITYNQSEYIRQAIDSALEQKTDFKFEIVIGDDCSTDGTREIVCEYATLHPDIIRPLLASKNLGMMGNFVATYKACQGSYIAILEGDDFWSNPQKLQTQIDFLEAHKEYSGCFHNVEILCENSKITHPFHTKPLKKTAFQQKDIVGSYFIPTCSTVFRAKTFEEFPNWFYDMPMADWPLHILNAQTGPYAYFHTCMATYRLHNNGVWSSKGREQNLSKTIQAIDIIKPHIPRSCQRALRKNIATRRHELSICLAEQKKYELALEQAVKAIIAAPCYIKISWRTIKNLHNYLNMYKQTR